MFDFKKYELPNFGYVRLPEIHITDEQRLACGVDVSNKDNFEFLKALCRKGWTDKKSKFNQSKIKEYEDRIKQELDLVKELDFVDYYLLVWMVINKMRELDAFIDHGRGSCASSLVFYILGITGVDPVEKGLFLSRFISKVRAKKKVIDGIVYIDGGLAPDVDINIGGVREQIISWLKELYKGKISKISNLSTYTGKILIKDVFKIVENASEDDSKEVSDLINKNAGIVEDIAVTYDTNEEFKKWADKHEKSYKIALKLRDLIKSKSIHASGYLISFDNLNDCVPLELAKDGELATTYTKDIAANFAIKLDLLGLTSDEIINDVMHNIDETIDDINLDNDPFIYNRFQDGKLLPYGLYQISADFAYRVLNQVKPSDVYGLSDVNALARPGASAWIEDYINNNAQVPHPAFKDILAKTKNLCLYQENLMQMAVVVGFSSEEAEILRRVIGKKKVDEVKEWKEKIYKKCEENGFEKSVGDILWQIADASSRYSFNLCLDPESTVELENGKHITLEQVNIGDKIKAYDIDSGLYVFVNITNKHESEAVIYYVKLNNDKSIKCSLNHKFLCSDLKMRSLYDILCYKHLLLGDTQVLFFYEIGLKRTLDLEVDHKDHNFYCNDIVTSNSHSVATSYISALTVYLKYKYPLQFYLACLKHAQKSQNPTDEMRLIAGEVGSFGIKIIGPHLTKSDMDFKIEDNNIRFGLSAIKGISEKSILRVKNFAKEYSNKFEIFIAAEQAGLTIGHLSALIQAGALDGYNISRSKLVLEAQVWNTLTAREIPFIIAEGKRFNFDLFEIIKHLSKTNAENGKPYIKESRLETIRAKYKLFKTIYNKNNANEEFANWFYEKSLLGYSYNTTLHNIFSKQINDLRTIKDIKDESSGVHIRFVGLIDDVIKKTSAAGNDYIKVDITDEFGNKLRVMLFERNFDKCLELNDGKELEKENIVTVSGTKKDDNAVFAQQIIIQDWKIYMKLSEVDKLKLPENEVQDL